MLNEKIVLGLVEEMKEEAKKVEFVPVYYKRKGQMVRRSFDAVKNTDRYTELVRIIRDAKVFTCQDCGKKVNYFGLCQGSCEECWGGDM